MGQLRNIEARLGIYCQILNMIARKHWHKAVVSSLLLISHLLQLVLPLLRHSLKHDIQSLCVFHLCVRNSLSPDIRLRFMTPLVSFLRIPPDLDLFGHI